MKVTIVAGHFSPEVCADVHLNKDLATDLAKQGLDITVLVPFPTRGVGVETQNEYVDKSLEKLSGNLKIIRVGVVDRPRNSLLIRALVWLKKAINLYRAAIKIDTDVYYVVSTPPFLGWMGALLAKNKPTIYKLQDLFPDSLVLVKGLKETNIIIVLLRKLEKMAYKYNTHLIAISDDMRKQLVEKNVDSKKISVAYDWIDTNTCIPIERRDNVLIEKFGLDVDGFYVSYAGNIGLLQNIETIVQAAKYLQDIEPQIEFIIIGDGSNKEKICNLIESSDVKNIKIFPLQAYEYISHVYSLGDIELVSLKPDVTRIALPSKTWSILSAARPVVCEMDLYSTICKIIEDNSCGICVKPGDYLGMAAAILKLYANKDIISRMGQNGRKYVEENLTREIATQRHFSIVKQVFEGRGGNHV